MDDRRALVVWGGWAGHEPRQAVEVFVPVLERQGFAVTVADSLAPFGDQQLMASLSLVVPCWTMGTLAPDEERGLLGAVRAGVGIAGWHGGMGDAFRASTGYQMMVGGQFVDHPGGIIDHAVAITDRLDPITAGIPSFRITTEQYYLHVDPSNHVLASTVFDDRHHDWIGGTVMPVAWKRPYGRGRVFYCAIGHVAADLAVPEVRTMIERGMLWAAAS